MSFSQYFLMSPGGGDPAAGGGGIFMIVWFGLIFVLMYFMLIRPQRKRQKDHEKLISELKKGDKVVMNSGLFGTIFAMDDQNARIILKTADDVKLEFLKSSIASKVEK